MCLPLFWLLKTNWQYFMNVNLPSRPKCLKVLTSSLDSVRSLLWHSKLEIIDSCVTVRIYPKRMWKLPRRHHMGVTLGRQATNVRETLAHCFRHVWERNAQSASERKTLGMCSNDYPKTDQFTIRKPTKQLGTRTPVGEFFTSSTEVCGKFKISWTK